MKKFIKVMSVIMAIAMVLCCFAACSGSSDKETTSAASDESTSAASESSADLGTIKIGANGPLTGPAAIYGTACKNAAQIAVDEINAKGGLQFELNYQDDEHDAEKSINAYHTLQDWGMQVMLGTVTTAPGKAVAPLASEDGIFFLTPSASSTEVIGGQDGLDRNETAFQMCFTDPNQGIASADYIAEKYPDAKIAVIYNNGDAYSTGIYQKFEAEAKEKNLEIVDVTTFTDDSANDFSAQLTSAKDKGADMLFLPIYYTPASLILTQADKMNYKPTVFGVDGMDGILTVENFDTKLAEGVLLLTPFATDAEDDLTKSFVATYKEKYSDTPNQFAADAYDCVYAIYNACVNQKISGDMSAKEISEKLIAEFTSDSFTFDGLTGSNITWSESGEVSKAPKAVVIQNGVYVNND